MQQKPSKNNSNKLWTYDFTVITVGSLISLVGNTLSIFAISLVVLDYTGSTFLYALYTASNQIPMLICPVLVGPYLDRVSRKKMICRLDFASATIYLIIFLLLRAGWFSYPILLAVCLLIGTINSAYVVAYESFYPNLISEGNYQKAYSVSNVLWPLAAMATPLAAAFYEWTESATPIFAVNALCFFAAACFKRTIRHQESHIARGAEGPDGKNAGLRQFWRDFTEGVTYLRGERGLLLMALYTAFCNICYSADTLQLPFFRNNAHLFAAWPIAAVTLYSVVVNCGEVGRFAGGLVQYRIKLPARKKFVLVLVVYGTINLLSGTVLYLPVPLMAVSFFLNGALVVTAYTMSAAATQAYVPDSKRARFNGVSHMLTSVGSITGYLLVGSLAEFFPERRIILVVNLFALLAIYLLLWRGRRHVAPIYNRDL